MSEYDSEGARAAAAAAAAETAAAHERPENNMEIFNQACTRFEAQVDASLAAKKELEQAFRQYREDVDSTPQIISILRKMSDIRREGVALATQTMEKILEKNPQGLDTDNESEMGMLALIAEYDERLVEILADAQRSSVWTLATVWTLEKPKHDPDLEQEKNESLTAQAGTAVGKKDMEDMLRLDELMTRAEHGGEEDEETLFLRFRERFFPPKSGERQNRIDALIDQSGLEVLKKIHTRTKEVLQDSLLYSLDKTKPDTRMDDIISTTEDRLQRGKN